jgi:general secretion pathway protein M
MRQWFEALDARERLFVLAAGVVVVFAALWFGLWAPLDRGHRDVSQRVESWESSLAELRPMRGQIVASSQGQANVNPSNQSLVVIVDNSLRQRGLTNALQRSQPTPSGTGIRVEFENAAFDDLMLWLGDLHRSYGLELESGSFSVSSSDSPGRVNASVTLQR